MLSHFLGNGDGTKRLLVSMRSSILILRKKQSKTPHIHCTRTYSNCGQHIHCHEHILCEYSSRRFFITAALNHHSMLIQPHVFASRFVNQRCFNQSSDCALVNSLTATLLGVKNAREASHAGPNVLARSD